MVASVQHQRILVVPGNQGDSALLETLARPELQNWTTLQAMDLEQARFLLQHDGCEVVLIDQTRCDRQDVKGLVHLSTRLGTPVIVLIATPEDHSADALLRLPRDLVLHHPWLLHEALAAALRERTLGRRACRMDLELQDCRRHIDHLLTLLWEVSPAAEPVQWFPQRFLVERLDEEVARARRYRTSISVAVGAMTLLDAETNSPAIRARIVGRIMAAKRRSDVVGQYGPRGFLLIMPNTPLNGAVVCCRRLQELLEKTPPTGSEQPPTRAARTYFGIASNPGDEASLASLLARAEGGLEKAERDGADCVVCI